MSGVAYAADCGHKLHMAYVPSMDQAFGRCDSGLDISRKHPFIPLAGAEKELETIMAGLRFDEQLVAAVATELSARRSVPEVSADEVSPEARQLRAALASLGADAFADLRASLEARLTAIEDQRRPKVEEEEAARFTASVDDLRRWPEIWALAGAGERNRLLRAAGITIGIQALPRPDGRQGRVTRIAWIRAEVPQISLALATALGELDSDLSLDGSRCLYLSNPSSSNRVLLVLKTDQYEILHAAFATVGKTA